MARAAFVNGLALTTGSGHLCLLSRDASLGALWHSRPRLCIVANRYFAPITRAMFSRFGRSIRPRSVMMPAMSSAGVTSKAGQ